MLVMACKPSTNKQESIQYYNFSMVELLKNFKNEHANIQSVSKLVIQQKNTEQKNISYDELMNDIQTFSEFDINKAAWKNSYKEIKYEKYTRYLCLENKLPIKYIDVYGDLKKPTRVYIYFLNTNNLYTSSKIINWEINKSYSIYSIQDVKGMEADTIYIRSAWQY